MNKIKVDNRILKCLFCITGDKDREIPFLLNVKKDMGLCFGLQMGSF